ncbi:hypothetical protein PJN15_29290, partial [Mycobacterium kansasii]
HGQRVDADRPVAAVGQFGAERHHCPLDPVAVMAPGSAVLAGSGATERSAVSVLRLTGCRDGWCAALTGRPRWIL